MYERIQTIRAHLVHLWALRVQSDNLTTRQKRDILLAHTQSIKREITSMEWDIWDEYEEKP